MVPLLLAWRGTDWSCGAICGMRQHLCCPPRHAEIRDRAGPEEVVQAPCPGHRPSAHSWAAGASLWRAAQHLHSGSSAAWISAPTCSGDKSCQPAACSGALEAFMSKHSFRTASGGTRAGDTTAERPTLRALHLGCLGWQSPLCCLWQAAKLALAFRKLLISSRPGWRARADPHMEGSLALLFKSQGD